MSFLINVAQIPTKDVLTVRWQPSWLEAWGICCSLFAWSIRWWVCSKDFTGAVRVLFPPVIVASGWQWLKTLWFMNGKAVRTNGALQAGMLERNINNRGKIMWCKQCSNLKAQFWLPFSVCTVLIVHAQTYRCRFCFAWQYFTSFLFLLNDEPDCQREFSIISTTPTPLSKALMRLWIQFNERDRCSLLPAGQPVIDGFRPGNLSLILAAFPVQVAGLGRQHEANQVEEQPLPWCDPLPTPPATFPESQQTQGNQTFILAAHYIAFEAMVSLA